MKNLFIISLITITSFAHAQSGIIWDSPMDVSSNSFDNLHPRIVTDRIGNPMVIWGKLSSKQVYFSRLDSISSSFSMPVLINPGSIPVFTAGWAGPDIASHGDTVYVVMKETPEDTNHIYLSSSFDGGMNFNPPVQVENLIDSISRFPTVSTDSVGNPIVGYMNFELGFSYASYVVMRSNDYGNTFQSPVLASKYSGGDVCDCCPASLITSGNTAAMLYRDNLNNFRGTWAGISTDNCQTFPNGISVDHTNWNINACPSTGPDGIIIGDSLYSVFMSGASGDSRCYLNAASMSQLTSGNDLPLTGSIPGITNQNYPRIARSGNRVAIVCRQTVNGTGEVPLFFTDDITTMRPDSNYEMIVSGLIENCDVAMTENAIYVVWQDNNSGTVKFRRGLLPPLSTTVNNPDEDVTIHVYPNPAKDRFEVICTDELKSVEIRDASGRKVDVEIFISHSKAVCNMNASKGIYFIEIVTMQSTVSRKTILAGN